MSYTVLDYLPDLIKYGLLIAGVIPILQGLYGATQGFQQGFTLLGELIPLFALMMMFMFMRQLMKQL